MKEIEFKVILLVKEDATLDEIEDFIIDLIYNQNRNYSRLSKDFDTVGFKDIEIKE